MMTPSFLALVLLVILLAVTIIGLVKSNATSKKLHGSTEGRGTFDDRRE